MYNYSVVSCIFACPYDGPTSPSSVLNVVKQLLDMGCYEVGLGDTLGVGTPMDTQKLLEILLKEIPEDKLAGHFHDTYGQAVANVVRAYDMGIRTFDSSVAGLGGCPYAKGAKGNLATEDIVYTFERMGVSTGIDLPKLVSVGEWISRELGLPNGSRAGSALFAKQEAAAEAGTSASTASVSPPKQESAPTGLSSVVAPSQTSSLQEPPARAPSSVQNTSHPSSSPEPTRTCKPVEKTGGYSVSRSGNVVKITLTRPQNGNAMTNSMLVGLTRLFQTLARDRSVFHILIAAEGKYFCTGMDLSSGGTTTTSEKSHFSKFIEFFNAIDRAPQTTIAVIDGPAFGGGVGLSFACDIRLVSSRARFTLSEIKLGLSPAIISPYIIREWGISFAREAILSGREIYPTQLQHIGAVHGIADPPDTLEGMVNNYLDKLSKCAPRSATECKELVRLGWTDPGGRGQEVKIKETFENMMAEGSEGRFGIEQFRRKVRGIDWGSFWKGVVGGAKL
jgi:hydroxymethylglutaryl-CoA lyase